MFFLSILLSLPTSYSSRSYLSFEGHFNLNNMIESHLHVTVKQLALFYTQDSLKKATTIMVFPLSLRVFFLKTMVFLEFVVKTRPRTLPETPMQNTHPLVHLSREVNYRAIGRGSGGVIKKRTPTFIKDCFAGGKEVSIFLICRCL